MKKVIIKGAIGILATPVVILLIILHPVEMILLSVTDSLQGWFDKLYDKFYEL